MNTSATLAQLAEALSIAQGGIKGAIKDSTNPFYHQKYASLSSVWDACREPLSKNGLSIVQTCDISEDNRVIVETILLHNSGEWISGKISMTPTIKYEKDKDGNYIENKNDPQAIGSCISYARRYSLAAIVGIAPEDDDAESATTHPTNSDTIKKPQRVAPAIPKDGLITEEQINEIYELASKSGYDNTDIKKHMVDEYKVGAIKLMPQGNVIHFMKWLKAGKATNKES